MRSHFTHGLFFSLFSSLLMVPLVSLRDVNRHPGGLLFHPAGEVDQAIVHEAVGWIVVGQRSRLAVEFLKLVLLVVVEQRGTDRLRIAEKTDPARPRFDSREP